MKGLVSLSKKCKYNVENIRQIEKDVDGYGVGELSKYEFRKILTEVQKQLNVDINLG
jgi:mRNA-degrading endonuclease toxin of MazEF toxin-antitoxin module